MQKLHSVITPLQSLADAAKIIERALYTCIFVPEGPSLTDGDSRAGLSFSFHGETFIFILVGTLFDVVATGARLDSFR